MDTVTKGSKVTTAKTMTVYQQATTQVLHRTKGCGITSRTRYNHFVRELTAAEIAKSTKCRKCW